MEGDVCGPHACVLRRPHQTLPHQRGGRAPSWSECFRMPYDCAPRLLYLAPSRFFIARRSAVVSRRRWSRALVICKLKLSSPAADQGAGAVMAFQDVGHCPSPLRAGPQTRRCVHREARCGLRGRKFEGYVLTTA
eukprot:6580643-Prymnesium_polylepis.2